MESGKHNSPRLTVLVNEFFWNLHILTGTGNGYKKTDAVSSVHYHEPCVISQPYWQHADWFLHYEPYSSSCIWIWIKPLFSLPYSRSFNIFLFFSQFLVFMAHFGDLVSSYSHVAMEQNNLSNLYWTVCNLQSRKCMVHIGKGVCREHCTSQKRHTLAQK